VAIVFACASSQARADQPLPLALFAQMPNMEIVTLSPDGQKIAFLSFYQNQRVLVVRNLVDGQTQLTYISEVRADTLFWADDHTVLMSASDASNTHGIGGVVDFSAVFAFDIDNGLAFRQLMQGTRRAEGNVQLGRILGISRQDGFVLIPGWDDDGNYDLLAADPARRVVRVAAHGDYNTRDWVVDEDGNAVARNEYSNSENIQQIEMRSGNEWVAVLQQRNAERPVFSTLGLLPDGSLAISAAVTREDGSTTVGLYSVSVNAPGRIRTVFSDDLYDISRVLTDPHTNRVVGVTYEDAFSEQMWFDTDLEERRVQLERVFPGKAVSIESWSRDRSRMLVATESESQPRIYYLYNLAQNTVQPLGSAYAALAQGGLRERRPIEFTARDGTQIPAYLLTPEGEGPFPTVILPHGGPATRDTGGFDYIAHFLASRGYAVLQPNFRGSSGYGLEWERAGFGQWGTGVMQDDVTDGAAELVRTGIADPDRICIVGASYGGYAALAGAAFTPDTYQCAAAIAPVADLNAMLRYASRRYGRLHWVVAYWDVVTHGEDQDRSQALLRAASPVYHADQIHIPVLLIHGRDDSVVPISQSRDMNNALRRRGGDVELVEMDDGDHWLTSVEMRTRVLTELERFLGEHIGGEAN
jgi:dipeptidyl aminopeptidase/acylaminoacyl peptidase